MTNNKIKAPAHVPGSFSLPLQLIHDEFSSLSWNIFNNGPWKTIYGAHIFLFIFALPVRNIFLIFWML